MKRSILLAVAFAALSVTACSKQTPQEKIQQQLDENVYSLTAEDRQRAAINAKSYFEKEWSIANNQRGMLNECRPSDSNANGMVTCAGFIPTQSGTFTEQKRFCGYTPKLVGCSDKDDSNF